MDWSNVTYKQDYTVFERAFISSNNERESVGTIKEIERSISTIKNK